MGQHLNRLDNKDALKWDTAYEQFCKTKRWDLWEEQMAKITKVYLVEVEVDDIRQPIAIKTNWELAFRLVKGKNGRITEMAVGREYPNGLQICLHWDFYTHPVCRSERIEENHET